MRPTKKINPRNIKFKRSNNYKVKVIIEKDIYPIISPLGPLVRPPKNKVRVHFDYNEAQQYCRSHGKRLQDLTPDEKEQFKIQAISVQF